MNYYWLQVIYQIIRQIIRKITDVLRSEMSWIRHRTAALGPILMRVYKPLQPLEQLYRHPNVRGNVLTGYCCQFIN